MLRCGTVSSGARATLAQPNRPDKRHDDIACLRASGRRKPASAEVDPPRTRVPDEPLRHGRPAVGTQPPGGLAGDRIDSLRGHRGVRVADVDGSLDRTADLRRAHERRRRGLGRVADFFCVMRSVPRSTARPARATAPCVAGSKRCLPATPMRAMATISARFATNSTGSRRIRRTCRHVSFTARNACCRRTRHAAAMRKRSTVIKHRTCPAARFQAARENPSFEKPDRWPFSQKAGT